MGRQLLNLLITLVAAVGFLNWAPPAATAAEILSIRSATELQVGDQNRSYRVNLACLEVDEANNKEAMMWLRQHGSRGTKVNLRPLGERGGSLIARVRILKTGLDLSDGMVTSGLATSAPCLQGDEFS